MFERRTKIFSSFRAKLTLILIGAMMFSAGFCNVWIYQYALHDQFEQLRSRLMIIAQIAALSMDGDELMRIPLDKHGVETEVYKKISRQLTGIKNVDPSLKYVYTMTRSGEDGSWRFIVDPDAAELESKGITSFPGDRYDASRFPEMLQSFERPTADRKFQIDRWGVTLSGYAPVRDDSGQVVAMLGVDMAADDVYALQQKVHRREMAVMALGVAVSLIVGTLLSQRMSYRIEKLLEGTKRIADGDFRYQVKIEGNDEITELAHGLNMMARSLFVSRKKTHKYFYRAMQSLVRILEAKDVSTMGHSERVTDYAGKIAFEMRLSEEETEILKDAARLHDIGKLTIPNTILNKQERLTDAEWDVIKSHPGVGADILKPVVFDKHMLSVVKYHHERYDGTGYPDRLKGDDIDIFTAIISAADAYDAMTSDRPYRKALSREAALAEMERCKATQFRPDVVEALKRAILKEKAA